MNCEKCGKHISDGGKCIFCTRSEKENDLSKDAKLDAVTHCVFGESMRSRDARERGGRIYKKVMIILILVAIIAIGIWLV